MAGMDVALFRAVNRWPSWLDPGLTYFSVAHDTLLFRVAMVAILVGMVWRGCPPRRTAISAIVAFPLADFLCNLVKGNFPMRRPFQDMPGEVVMRVGTSESMGTASSHAANLAAVATVMTLGLGLRWGSPWIVIALFVGASRVYVGAHYPSQVLLGYAVGIGSGLLIHELCRLLLKNRQPSVAADGP